MTFSVKHESKVFHPSSTSYQHSYLHWFHLLTPPGEYSGAMCTEDDEGRGGEAISSPPGSWRGNSSLAALQGGGEGSRKDCALGAACSFLFAAFKAPPDLVLNLIPCASEQCPRKSRLVSKDVSQLEQRLLDLSWMSDLGGLAKAAVAVARGPGRRSRCGVKCSPSSLKRLSYCCSVI